MSLIKMIYKMNFENNLKRKNLQNIICNFFVVGFSKSGTSWLARMLKNNDDIFVPDSKEIHYFNEEGIGISNITNPNKSRSIEWYHNHFKESKNKLKGDFSPLYILSSAKNIKKYNKDAKIVILIRDPISRTISDYKYRIQKGWLSIDTNFEKAVQKYPEIINHSLYSEKISNYIQTFKKEQLLILFYDDIKENPGFLLDKCTDFLGVKNCDKRELFKKINKTNLPKNQKIIFFLIKIKIFFMRIGLHDFVRFIASSKYFKKFLNFISNDIIEDKSINKVKIPNKFLKLFLTDIKKLERIVSKDLSIWSKEIINLKSEL